MEKIIPSDFVNVRLVSKQEWQGKVLIKLSPAPEKPGLGQPGQEAGEVGPVLVQGKGENPETVLVSLGSLDKLNDENIRRVGSAIIHWLQKNEFNEAAIDLTEIPDQVSTKSIYALIEGIYLGAYRFERFKSQKSSGAPIQVFMLVNKNQSQHQEQLDQVKMISQTVNQMREWDHQPANVINPITLAALAQQVANENGLKVTIFNDEDLRDMGAGAILAVGQGSQTPSRMIVLEYPGQETGRNRDPVVLVGKAITFDTGGYSLKTVEGIQGMKYDKSGGLVVLATLQAAAQLKLNTPLVGVICAAENMVSPQAYRPDDIITSLSGKTIEIISTDAEGRLVMADGLTYAQKHYQPSALIDLATLTGGVVVALGHVRAGIMSNNDDLAQQLIAAGEKTHERLWRLPLDEDYFTNIKGDEADIKNSGGREGAPIYGGIFLQQFVESQVPWAHLDIAGTAHQSKDLPYSTKGATGFGVRLLVEFLKNR